MLAVHCYSHNDECAEKVRRVEDEKAELLDKIDSLAKEVADKEWELNEQKEANSRAPTQTMKNHVERLKNQLAMKEKQQQVWSICLHAYSLTHLFHAARGWAVNHGMPAVFSSLFNCHIYTWYVKMETFSALALLVGIKKGTLPIKCSIPVNL